MERKQTRPYRVAHLRTGRVFDFSTGEDVATHIFVLGNFDLPNFAIYNAGRRWRYPKGKSMEVSELARKLEEWKR